MGYKTDDNELMDAVLFELQVEVRVREATGAPVLKCHDLTRLRCELAAKLATPRPEFECSTRPRRFLDRRDISLGLVIARTESTMRRIEDAKARFSRRIQNL